MRNVKNDPPPPPGRRGAGREAEGAGAGQRPRGTPPPPAPRAPQPRRAASPGDSRLPEAAGAAHGFPGAACQPPSLPSCPSARPLRPRVRGRENGDGPALALSPAVPTSGSRRRPPVAAAGTVRPFPTAALHRRARRAARENPDGSAGGRRLGGRREGYARAGNPMRGRAPRASRVPIGGAA